MNTNKRAADFVRSLMIVTKTGGRLYSDKTKFGRSIKVTGWSDYAYETAVRVLDRYGYESKIVTNVRTERRVGKKYRVVRLYVYSK